MKERYVQKLDMKQIRWEKKLKSSDHVQALGGKKREKREGICCLSSIFLEEMYL